MTSSATLSSIFQQNPANPSQHNYQNSWVSSNVKEQWKHSFELFQMLKISIKQMPDIDVSEGYGAGGGALAAMLRQKSYELRKVAGFMGQIYKNVFNQLKNADPSSEIALSQGLAASSSQQSRPNGVFMGKRESVSFNSVSNVNGDNQNHHKQSNHKPTGQPSSSSSRMLNNLAKSEQRPSDSLSSGKQSPAEVIPDQFEGAVKAEHPLDPSYFHDIPESQVKLESMQDASGLMDQLDDQEQENPLGDFEENEDILLNMRIHEAHTLLPASDVGKRSVVVAEPVLDQSTNNKEPLASQDNEIFMEDSVSDEDDANECSLDTSAAGSQARKSNQQVLEEQLKVWIDTQSRTTGEALTSKMINEKAKSLSAGGDQSWCTAKGWLAKFKRRHKEFFDQLSKLQTANKRNKK